MPVTVLTRVRTVRMWFLYSWMALGSVKKSLQSVAVVVQLVYAHLFQMRLESAYAHSKDPAPRWLWSA